MVLPLRVILLVFAVLFTYFFGGTLEHFLLDVVRFFIAVEMSNAISYNLLHLAITTAPLLVLGVIGSVPLSSDAKILNRYWWIILGVVLSIAGYKCYQLWWLFRGGFMGDSEIIEESMSEQKLFWLQNVLPFIVIGSSASLIGALWEKKTPREFCFVLLYPIISYGWMRCTHKLQSNMGSENILIDISICFLSGLGLSLMIYCFGLLTQHWRVRSH